MGATSIPDLDKTQSSEDSSGSSIDDIYSDPDMLELAAYYGNLSYTPGSYTRLERTQQHEEDKPLVTSEDFMSFSPSLKELIKEIYDRNDRFRTDPTLRTFSNQVGTGGKTFAMIKQIIRKKIFETVEFKSGTGNERVELSKTVNMHDRIVLELSLMFQTELVSMDPRNISTLSNLINEVIQEKKAYSHN